MDQSTGRAYVEGLRDSRVAQRRAQADELFFLTELAHGYEIQVDDLCELDRFPSSKLPSHKEVERARAKAALFPATRRLGGQGTPEVSEFLCYEVAAALQCSASVASSKLADAIDLRWRHRNLWQAVQGLQLDRDRAVKAARMCRELDPMTANGVGLEWAERQERLGWRASFALLEELIAKADADLALKKQEQARRRREVQVRHNSHGSSWLFADMDALDARILDGTLNDIACFLRRKGVPGRMQELRAKSLGLLAVPALALKIQQEALLQPTLPNADTPLTLPNTDAPPALPETDTPPVLPDGLSGLLTALLLAENVREREPGSQAKPSSPSGSDSQLEPFPATAVFDELSWVAEHLADREDALAELFSDQSRWLDAARGKTTAVRPESRWGTASPIQDFRRPPVWIPIPKDHPQGTSAPSSGQFVHGQAQPVAEPHLGTCLGHRCGTIDVPLHRLLPKVKVVIHVDARDLARNAGDGDAEDTAWIEHVGSVAVDDLRIMLADKQVVAQPVIDLNTIPAEHDYRPSTRMADAARTLRPYEAFPYSARPSTSCDLDHTVAYQPSTRDAQTHLGNLAPLSRKLHRAKTLGAWTCDQPEPGVLEWTSPLGFRYEVGPEGTTPLN